MIDKAIAGIRALTGAVRDLGAAFDAVKPGGARDLDEVLDEGFRRKALPKTTEHLRQLARKAR